VAGLRHRGLWWNLNVASISGGVTGRIGAAIEGELHSEVTRILYREFLEVVAAGEQRGDRDDENYDNRSTHVHMKAQTAGGCDAGRPGADERPDDQDVVVIERAVTASRSA
jgi:hypothetical protein